MNIVSFIDEGFDGEIFFESEKIYNTHCSAQIRRHEIGYIFQDFKLIDEYTILQNLEIILSLINVREKGLIIEKTFSRLNLSLSYLNQYPNQVSGGEKQRIALARALIKNPKIIIGDEVTGSLDRHHASKIIEILQELNEEGITIIIATHDESLFHVGNRLITVKDGQIYED